jgi:hypothetical protein
MSTAPMSTVPTIELTDTAQMYGNEKEVVGRAALPTAA